MTYIPLPPENFENNENTQRINQLLVRLQDGHKGICTVNVQNYDSDPVVFVYTFNDHLAATNFSNGLDQIKGGHPFPHHVVGNQMFESRPLNSLPALVERM